MKNKDAQEMKPLVIFVVSDSLSEIGELLVNAGKSCFEKSIKDVRFHPFVDDKLSIDYLLELAKQEHGLIVYTMSSIELKAYMEVKARQFSIPTYDVMGSLVETLRSLTGEEPIKDKNVLTELDTQYYKKLEAIEFTVKYDDGKHTSHLNKADIILLGASRTSKTPLSIYLANNNYKVANIPLMPEVEPPQELFEIASEKIFGLMLDPNQLVNIRTERLKAMGITGVSNYGSYERVILELKKAQELFDKLGCTVIDVTSKAIEEIAATILKIL
jgi:regulator of PEP synthase PpsR (kinase-PPPase family)